MRAARAERGVTMVELLVAFVVIGILFAVALPPLGETIASRRVQAVAHALAASLKTAQAEAIRRNRAVEVAFTNTSPVAANTVAAVPAAASAARAWIVREVNPTGVEDYVGGQSLTGDLDAVTVRNDAVRSIAFTPTARVVDLSAGPAAAAALAAPLALRVESTGTTRRLCVAVGTGGSVRVCDPARASGTAGACQPALPAGAC